MKTSRPTLLALLAVTTSLAAHGQEPTTFRAGVDGVRLDVRVTEHGAPVAGLRANDFVVTDNGGRQMVGLMTMADAPLRICLLLDSSGSLEGARLSQLQMAANAIVASLHPLDQIALFTFSQSLRRDVDYTNDRQRIVNALSGARAGSATALRDAVFSTLQLVPPGEMRTVLFLLTDGVDNASWLTAKDVEEAAAQGDAVLEVIHVTRMDRGTSAAIIAPNALTASPPPQGDSDRSPRVLFLKNLARLSGGQYWPVEPTAPLSNAFVRALEDIRTRYILFFSPPSPNKPGWHDVKVRVPSRRAAVIVRPRYWVPFPSTDRPGPAIR